MMTKKKQQEIGLDDPTSIELGLHYFMPGLTAELKDK